MENVRMLSQKDEGSDVEVVLEDQERINAYSTLNHRLTDIEESLVRLKDEHEQLEDLRMELELADEDEPILFKIAAAFYHLTAAKATERMDEEVETLEGNLEALEREQDECKEKMDELKATLYAKFGSAINLERS